MYCLACKHEHSSGQNCSDECRCPSSGRIPWIIFHLVDGKEHVAWLQRALIPGDFRPGTPPLPNYVVYPDGYSPHPEETPKCTTCGVVPEVKDLEPEERSTGGRGHLDRFRDTRRPDWKPWVEAGRTKAHTCYVCNTQGPLAQKEPILLCIRCEENLRRGGE